MSAQPIPLHTLANQFVIAEPLLPGHFDALYQAASDPAIWTQHPNPNRWQLPDFTNYFNGAIESGGAYLVRDAADGTAIGSSRYSDYNEEKNSIHIGYTFFAVRCWGKPYNYSLKKLMLDHAFHYVEEVMLYIGAGNIRSQKSIEKLGAQKIAEEMMAYVGEGVKLNFVYRISHTQWQTLREAPRLAKL